MPLILYAGASISIYPGMLTFDRYVVYHIIFRRDSQWLSYTLPFIQMAANGSHLFYLILLKIINNRYILLKRFLAQLVDGRLPCLSILIELV